MREDTYLGARRAVYWTWFGARLTLAMTWPQGVIGEEDSQADAAQVNGGVREWQECWVQEALTPLQSPSPLHLGKSAR